MITPSPVSRSQFSCFQLELKEQARGKHSKTDHCRTEYFATFSIVLEHKAVFILLYLHSQVLWPILAKKKWVLRYLLKSEFDCKSFFNFKLFSAFEKKFSSKLELGRFYPAQFDKQKNSTKSCLKLQEK